MVLLPGRSSLLPRGNDACRADSIVMFVSVVINLCGKMLKLSFKHYPPKVYPHVFFGRNYSLLMSEIIFLYMAYILTREI